MALLASNRVVKIRRLTLPAWFWWLQIFSKQKSSFSFVYCMVLNLVNFFCERAVQICIILWTCPRTRKQKSKVVKKFIRSAFIDIELWYLHIFSWRSDMSWVDLLSLQNKIFCYFKFRHFYANFCSKNPK